MTEARIQVPDGYEPDGPWPGFYRAPIDGDVIYHRVHGHTIYNGGGTAVPRIILRKVFDAAEWWARHPWIIAEWIAMDGGTGVWVAHQSEPRIDTAGASRNRWWSDDDMALMNGNGLFDFDPPPCNDWRQSKMRNPRCDI